MSFPLEDVEKFGKFCRELGGRDFVKYFGHGYIKEPKFYCVLSGRHRINVKTVDYRNVLIIDGKVLDLKSSPKIILASSLGAKHIKMLPARKEELNLEVESESEVVLKMERAEFHNSLKVFVK